MVLASDASPNESVATPDLLPVELAPGVVGHAHLVAPHGVPDPGELDAFRAPQLGDRHHVDEQQTLRLVDERPLGRGQLGRGCSGRTRHRRQQGAGDRAPRVVVGLGERDRADARIADQEPVRQVALLLHDPEDRVEERLHARAARPGLGRVRGDERPGEQALLGLSQIVVARDKPGRKVDDERHRLPLENDQALQRLAKQVEAGGGAPACRCEADAAQDAFASGRGLRIGRRHPEAAREIIGDRVGVSGAPQLAVEHRHERRRRHRARRVLQKVVVPDIAREDELALERQEPPEVP